MKKVLLLLAAISILWIYQSTENVASAHGGSYRGPAGEVPPGQRDPKDPQPPPEPPGAGTPPPGGGTPTDPGGPGTGTDPGGSDNPPPDTGGGPPAPPQGPAGPAIPGGAATPGGKRTAGPPPLSFDNWLFWWAYNKDEILNIKAALKRRANQADSSSSVFFFGEGEAGSGSTAPTTQMIQKEIVPALRKVVENKDIHPDIRGGALIALARCRGEEHLDLFFKLAERDNGEDKVVQESAILALGIGQYKKPEVRNYLINLVDDPKYPFRGRCFAMICMGLLEDNHQDVIDCLKRRLDGSESTNDVPVCALLSLGLLRDNKLVPELIEWLDTGRAGKNGMKFEDLEKAWVISALGKIGDPSALKAVTDVLKKKGMYATRSAMIAVGQLLPQADEKTQATFVQNFATVVENENEQTAKNFGMISLGRIGGAKGASEEVRARCRKILEKQFIDGNKVTERPYASLAIGLLCFGDDKPQQMREELGELIRKDLADLKGDQTALGAEAISLGMIGDKRDKTVNLLVSILKDRGRDKKLRGSAAMALGLIGNRSASEAIMKALEEREDRDLRVDTAVAAGLLGDSTAVSKLVSVLNDPKASQFVLGSVALALGQIGDKEAVTPLIGILEPDKVNGTYPDLTRALVAVALGQIADQSDIRVLSRLSKDINYRASVQALDEILTIL